MSAKVVAVANQKGGVGKTTLAMNLAAGLSRRGTCIVVDADPQGSATMWTKISALPKRFPVEVVSKPDSLPLEIVRLREQYTYIVIDCPPEINSGYVTSAMENADVLLIPVLPSPMDLWASTRIEELIERLHTNNNSVSPFIVLNQIEPRNAMSRSMDAALVEVGIPVLRHRLTRRAIYRTSALEGCSVYELGARGKVAVEEVNNIIDEVLSI